MSFDDPSESTHIADGSSAEHPDGETPEIDEGRYLYCLVCADEDADLEQVGVDGEPVSLVTADGIGAVVHPTNELYDSADIAEIRRWLVRHQTVVDAAADRFGTPIPFQFDTILRGDDDRVREWLRTEHGTISSALESLTDHWEYRIEVVDVDPISDERLIEQDDRLGKLQARIDDSEEGTAFLLEKKRDHRLEEVRVARREQIAADLEARLAELVREVHTLERSPTVGLADDVTDGGADGGETYCRLTVLAHADDEGAVGSVLDQVAATDGLEVRFTGPWPPYTFAPELGGDRSSEESSGGVDDQPGGRVP